MLLDQEEEREPVPQWKGVSLPSNQTSFEDVTAVLERARFLYQGPNDKQDMPVFYLIVNRFVYFVCYWRYRPPRHHANLCAIKNQARVFG